MNEFMWGISIGWLLGFAATAAMFKIADFAANRKACAALPVTKPEIKLDKDGRKIPPTVEYVKKGGW